MVLYNTYTYTITIILMNNQLINKSLSSANDRSIKLNITFECKTFCLIECIHLISTKRTNLKHYIHSYLTWGCNGFIWKGEVCIETTIDSTTLLRSSSPQSVDWCSNNAGINPLFRASNTRLKRIDAILPAYQHCERNSPLEKCKRIRLLGTHDHQ